MSPKVDIPDEVKAGDWVEHFSAAEMGKFFYFRDVMSVYRLHGGGVWTSLDNRERVESSVYVMKFLDKLSKGKYERDFESAIKKKRLGSNQSVFKLLKRFGSGLVQGVERW